MKKLLLLILLPALAWGQYSLTGFATGSDSINLRYINGMQLTTHGEYGLPINGNILHDRLLEAYVDTNTGTNADRNVVIAIKRMGGNALSASQRMAVRIWGSTSEFGAPGKLSRVTIENLTGTAYAIRPTWTQGWAPETTVETVMTEADGEIHFRLTSTGDEDAQTQWVMVEIQGIVYSFDFTMWAVLSGGG